LDGVFVFYFFIRYLFLPAFSAFGTVFGDYCAPAVWAGMGAVFLEIFFCFYCVTSVAIRVFGVDLFVAAFAGRHINFGL